MPFHPGFEFGHHAGRAQGNNIAFATSKIEFQHILLGRPVRAAASAFIHHTLVFNSLFTGGN